MNLAAQLSESLAQTVKRVGPSVVRVEGGRVSGSGIAWSADLVVTVGHGLDRDDTVEVGLADGSTVEATVVGRDPATDLAVLRTRDAKLTPAQFGDGRSLEVGHLLLGIARPGRSARAVMAMAMAIGGELRTHGGGKLDRYIQLDVGRYPGFNGGAVAELNGEVLGLGTGALIRGAAVVVPHETLRRVVDAIVSHGQVKRGFLGVGVFPVRLPDAVAAQTKQRTGALLISVQPGSAAEQAGLVLGDVLISLDGRPVTQPGELIALLDEDRVGKTAIAQILRGGAVKDVTITIGTRGWSS